MREETQTEWTCVYCKLPITPDQFPCKGLSDGRKAHITCYVEHMDDEKETPE